MSEEMENYLKINLLLKIITKIISEKYKHIWYENYGSFWQDIPEYGKRLISIIDRDKNLSEAFNKSQKSLILNGDTNLWDINLFLKIISSNEFKEKTIYENLITIKNIRSKISHNPNFQIDLKEYEAYFEVLIEKIKTFGYNNEKIKGIEDMIKNVKIGFDDGFSFKNTEILNNKNERLPEDLINKKSEAIKFFENKNYQKAIEAFDEALVIGTGISEKQKAILYCNKSICFYEKFKLNGSEENLFSSKIHSKHAIILDPTYMKAYFRLGLIYEGQKEFKKALHNYNKCLLMDKDNKTLKEKIDKINFILMQENLQDHLNPDNFPSSYEEIVAIAKNKLKEMKGDDFNKEPPLDYELLKRLQKENNIDIPIDFDVIEGHKHYHGSDDIQQDYCKAAFYYSKSANNGNAEGLYNLARLTIRGLGVKQDIKFACDLLEKASNMQPTILLKGMEIENLGVKEAQHYLGLLYENGVYFEKDYFKAKEYYQKAIKNLCGSSANNLGLMFLNGHGVDRDLKKAEKLFLNASAKNDINAYYNLVSVHLEKLDPFKAEEIHKKSKERNCMRSIMEDNQIMEMIHEQKKILSQNFDISDENLLIFEIKHNFTSVEMTKNERLERYIKFNKDSYDKFQNMYGKNFDNMRHFMQNLNERKSEDLEGLTYDKFGYVQNKYDPEKLKEENLNNPTQTTKKLVSCIENLKSIYNLICTPGKIGALKEKQTEILNKVKIALESESPLCGYLRYLEPFFKDIIEKIIKNNNRNDLDISARLFKWYLNFNCFKENAVFLKECVEKYPKYSNFYLFLGSILCFLKRFEEAIVIYNEGLIIDTENIELLYNKAAALGFAKKIETKSVYELFLSKANKDHRKVPEAYYSIAFFLFDRQDKEENKDSVIEEIEKYFSFGLESEKNQLFCYLPYVSTHKEMIKNFLEMKEKFSNFNNDPKNNKTPLSNIIINFQANPKFSKNSSFDYSSDYHRQELILHQRKSKKKYHEYSQSKKLNLVQDSVPRQKRIMQNYTNLNKIYLSNIDFTYDHIEKGKYLLCIVIEAPNLNFTSLMTVVEDEENNVERIAIYNLNESKIKQKNNFRIGTVIKIMNPYIRIANDGFPMIRIDDIDSFQIQENIPNPCNLCLKSKCSNVCNKCKNALYCSKTCQIIDWDIYKHNLACGIE